MRSAERSQVRSALLGRGFRRTAVTPDPDNFGDYTEVFETRAGDKVTIDWAERTPVGGAPGRCSSRRFPPRDDRASVRSGPEDLRPRCIKMVGPDGNHQGPHVNGDQTWE